MRPALAFALVLLSGTAFAAPVTDSDWYLGHPDVRDRVIATCDEDPNRLASDSDCIDAHDAETRAPHPGFFGEIADFFEDLL